MPIQNYCMHLVYTIDLLARPPTLMGKTKGPETKPSAYISNIINNWVYTTKTTQWNVMVDPIHNYIMHKKAIWRMSGGMLPQINFEI